MTDPDAGPVYVLPEPAPLDARSAAGLAINMELDKQLAAQPNAMVAIDPGPIADAVLGAVGDYPQIPKWLDEPRSVGGGRAPGQTTPDATVRVDVPLDDDGDPLDVGFLRFAAEIGGAPGKADDPPVTGYARVPADDAEQWALAVLAACRRTRAAAG